MLILDCQDNKAEDRPQNVLEANPRYGELNEQGRKIFGGRPYFEVQREISKRIEEA